MSIFFSLQTMTLYHSRRWGSMPFFRSALTNRMYQTYIALVLQVRWSDAIVSSTNVFDTRCKHSKVFSQFQFKYDGKDDQRLHPVHEGRFVLEQQHLNVLELAKLKRFYLLDAVPNSTCEYRNVEYCIIWRLFSRLTQSVICSLPATTI